MSLTASDTHSVPHVFRPEASVNGLTNTRKKIINGTKDVVFFCLHVNIGRRIECIIVI